MNKKIKYVSSNPIVIFPTIDYDLENHLSEISEIASQKYLQHNSKFHK